jgi:ribosomal protein L29
MKVADLRKLPTGELTTQCNSLREEIVELKRQISLGDAHNVRLARLKRKDLARTLTVLGEQLTKEKI